MKCIGMHVVQCQPLFMFPVSRGPYLLVQCSAADIRVLLTLFKRGPRNVVFPLPDTCRIKQALFFLPKFYKLSEVKVSDL